MIDLMGVRKGFLSGVALSLFSLCLGQGAMAQQNQSSSLIRGVVQPVNYASISTELNTLVADVPFREGERP